MTSLSTIIALILVAIPTCAATLNVKDFGAAADAKTDDTPAFQRALDAASKESGSTVFAPAGRYLIAGSVTVPPNATLKGEYFGPGRQRGTILLITGGKANLTAPAAVRTSGGSCIRNLAFEYPEQTADVNEPIAYPYTIHAGSDARIEDIFLYNSYQGINLDGSHANMVRNIWGEPLKIGINADHVYDISRIENVHFWPYFTLGKPLRNWVQANGIAFQFGRSDWQYCTNTFCFGYQTGYRFYTSKEVPEKSWPAGATNGNFTGIGADCVAIAIDVEDSFAIGISITNGEFAPFGGANTRAIKLHQGNTGNLTLVNCNFWAVTHTLAEVHSGSLNLSSCNIHEWGVTQKEAPCFIADGGRLTVNACTFNKPGLLAHLEGPATRALFTNNMGTDTLKITNGIGTRLITGNNNPPITETKH